MKTIQATIAVISLLVSASAARALEFIDSPSESVLFEGNLRIKAEAKEGYVFWAVTRRGTSTGRNQESKIKTSKPWFIAAESDSRVWVYDGETVLMRVEFSEKGIKFTDSAVVPELGQQAPKEVQDRIASAKK